MLLTFLILLAFETETSELAGNLLAESAEAHVSLLIVSGKQVNLKLQYSWSGTRSVSPPHTSLKSLVSEKCPGTKRYTTAETEEVEGAGDTGEGGAAERRGEGRKRWKSDREDGLVVVVW